MDDQVKTNAQLIAELTHLRERVAELETAQAARQRAEAALKKSEEWFRALFEEASDGIFYLSMNGELVEVNNAFARMHGYSIEEMRRMNLKDLDTPETSRQFPERMRRVMAGEVFIFEVEHFHKDGQAIPLEVTASLITVGNAQYVLAFHRDITERRRAEEALRESEARNHALLEAIPDMMFVQSRDGVYLDCRAPQAQLLLTPPEIFLGKNFRDVLPPQLAAALSPIFDRATQTGQSQLFEYALDLPDGRHHFEARIVAYQGGKVLSIIRDITERQRAAEALRESEEKYRGLVQGSPDAIAIYVDGRIVFANAASVQLMRANGVDDLLGRSVIELIHPDYREFVTRRMIAARQEDKPLALAEEKFIRLDGSAVDVEVKAIPITYERNPAVQIIARDITERKRAEAALRESEAKLKKAQHYARLGSWTWNIKTNQLDWSDEMFRLFGLERETFTGSLEAVIAQAIHPDDRPKVEQSNLSVSQHNQPVPLEYRVVWPDQSVHVVWAEAGEFLLDEAGKPALLSGTVQDITERKHAEDALRASEAFSQAILDNSPIGISVRSQTGRLLSANAAWKKIWAISEAALLDDHRQERQALTFNARDNYPKACQDDVRRVYEQGGSYFIPELKTAQARPGAADWVSQHFYAIQDARGQVDRVVILTEDITERKQLEQALLVERNLLEQHVDDRTRALGAANERLQELDRLKNKFVSDVSHELRTPITGLMLYLNLLDHGKPEKRAHYLATSIEQANRMKQLIEDILDLSRLERKKTALVFEPIDLNAVLERVVIAQQPRAEAAGLQLTFDAGPGLPLARGDVNQLLQVFTNLIANAISYTSAGKVSITSNAASDQVPPKDGDFMCVEVRDTGLGIDPVDLPHLFERFYRGQRTQGIRGTGLGLAIAKEIVEAHGGRLEVDSQIGAGSTFRVYLPGVG